jgi:hypothetical protein
MGSGPDRCQAAWTRVGQNTNTDVVMNKVLYGDESPSGVSVCDFITGMWRNNVVCSGVCNMQKRCGDLNNSMCHAVLEYKDDRLHTNPMRNYSEAYEPWLGRP